MIYLTIDVLMEAIVISMIVGRVFVSGCSTLEIVPSNGCSRSPLSRSVSDHALAQHIEAK